MKLRVQKKVKSFQYDYMVVYNLLHSLDNSIMIILYDTPLTVISFTPETCINNGVGRWVYFCTRGCKDESNNEKIQADNEVEAEGNCERILYWMKRVLNGKKNQLKLFPRASTLTMTTMIILSYGGY